MTGGAWIASYVILWATVLLLCLAVVVLLRQIGVLHARIRPLGVHFAGEGLDPGVPAPLAERFAFGEGRLTLLTFTSPTCRVCAELVPALRVLARDYDDVALRVVEHRPDTLAVFRAYNVSSTPYLVAVDGDGVVVGGGIANSLEQMEVLVESALHDQQPGLAE